SPRWSAAAGPPRRWRAGRQAPAGAAAAAGGTDSRSPSKIPSSRPCPSPPPTPSRRPSASRRSATSSSCSRTTFDPAALRARLRELEDQMQAPGFWDDSEAAAKVNTEHAQVSRKLEEFDSLDRDVEDLVAPA